MSGFGGYSNKMPLPRKFECRHCGDEVVVTERSDHRNVYCSQRCEKEYWRKRSKNDRCKKIGSGHVTHLWKEHGENRREAGF